MKSSYEVMGKGGVKVYELLPAKKKSPTLGKSGAMREALVGGLAAARCD